MTTLSANEKQALEEIFLCLGHEKKWQEIFRDKFFYGIRSLKKKYKRNFWIKLARLQIKIKHAK